ncbi:MAG: dioxygenase [Actinomycetaceae bacterium]|nr:dioxygenase [Actinomycetaceae bacterium]
MRMPVMFVGHGSPMIALENNELTKSLRDTGEYVQNAYGKPHAIVVMSAHRYTGGTAVVTDKKPRQIYDMYGFPEELYRLKYDVEGDEELAHRVLQMLGEDAFEDKEWGIDHGVWGPFVHLFPDADIPIVEIGVSSRLSESDIYTLGEKLSPLRDEGICIVGSGNIVHNLRYVDYSVEGGYGDAVFFTKQ